MPLTTANDAVTDMVENLRKDMNATFYYDDLKNQIKSAIASGGFPDIVQAPVPVRKKSAQ